MDNAARTELFENTPVPKAIAKLTVPTILSSLVMVLYNLADTYFVGALNDPLQNSAVTLAAPLLLAFNAVNNLFGVGSSSVMSRAMGRRDYDTVARSSAFGFWCALLGGVLLSLASVLLRSPLLSLLGADAETYAVTAQYIKWTVSCGAVPSILNVVMAYMVRSEGGAMHASIGTMSGCALNMVLDPVFIMPWGLGMGAAGAGLATFISNCAASCYFFTLLFVRRRRSNISISPKKLSFRRDIVLGIFGVGMPASIQNLLNVTGMTVLNNFTSVTGASAIAAMGIAQKINMVPFCIALGYSQGIMPLIGYNYASGNIARMKRTVTASVKLVVCCMLAVSAVYWLSAGLLVRTFMEDEVIVAFGTRFLRGFCLALPFLCMDFIAVGVFQAIGMGGKALAFAILRKLVLEIPLLLLLNRLFPLYGLPYAQPVSELVLAACATAMLIRLFRGLERKKAG